MQLCPVCGIFDGVLEEFLALRCAGEFEESVSVAPPHLLQIHRRALGAFGLAEQCIRGSALGAREMILRHTAAAKGTSHC